MHGVFSPSRRTMTALSNNEKNMRLYYHQTDGGAEYLMDTYIECPDGSKEGVINDETKYVVRIDGNIREDAELTVREDEHPAAVDK